MLGMRVASGQCELWLPSFLPVSRSRGGNPGRSAAQRSRETGAHRLDGATVEHPLHGTRGGRRQCGFRHSEANPNGYAAGLKSEAASKTSTRSIPVAAVGLQRAQRAHSPLPNVGWPHAGQIARELPPGGVLTATAVPFAGAKLVHTPEPVHASSKENLGNATVYGCTGLQSTRTAQHWTGLR